MMDLRKAQFARGVYGLGYHDVFVSYTKSKGDGDLPDHDWFIHGLTLHAFGERLHKDNILFKNKMKLSDAQSLIDDTIKSRFIELFGV